MRKGPIQGGWSSAPKATSNFGPPGKPSTAAFKPTYTKANAAQAAKTKPIQVLQPGLVHLPNIMDLETQQWIYDKVFELGAGDDKEGGGFYKLNGSALKLNMGKRGRVIESMDNFPKKFKELCDLYLEKARSLDPTLPANDVNTLLINFYSPGATFKWHKDSEDPNLIRESKGLPIISFSIGLSADFCYKNHYEDTDFSTVKLTSGDVLIFGGPSRMIVHSVQAVYPHTMPIGLRMRSSGEGRLNLTFRDVVGFLDETQFPKFRVSYNDADYILRQRKSEEQGGKERVKKKEWKKKEWKSGKKKEWEKESRKRKSGKERWKNFLTVRKYRRNHGRKARTNVKYSVK